MVRKGAVYINLLVQAVHDELGEELHRSDAFPSAAPQHDGSGRAGAGGGGNNEAGGSSGDDAGGGTGIESSDGKRGNSDTGMIVGISIAAAVLIVALALAALFLLRRRRRRARVCSPLSIKQDVPASCQRGSWQVTDAWTFEADS